MRRPEFHEPFEEEALETRAWEHYDYAREQGSSLSETDLIKHCREMAHKEIEMAQQVGNEPIPAGVDDEE
jgi:hypothetical protein